MGMHIELPIRQEIKQYRLRSWVKGRKFPSADHFVHIDVQRREYRRMVGRDNDPDWAFLQPIVSMSLNRGGHLGAYLDRKRVTVTDDEWIRVCQAAAWALLDEYEKAVAAGKWVPDL